LRLLEALQAAAVAGASSCCYLSENNRSSNKYQSYGDKPSTRHPAALSLRCAPPSATPAYDGRMLYQYNNYQQPSHIAIP
jgi:hypothetical protein